MGLQVATAEWSCPADPAREVLRTLHRERQGKRLFPLIVAVFAADRAFLLGPSGDAATTVLPKDQALRLLQAALDEPDGLAARTRLATLQRATSSTSPVGVTNEGLFADHYLATSAPKRPDWKACAAAAADMLALRHESLIRALGFTTQRAAGHALLLSAATAPRAVAVLLQADEQFDAATRRFELSPVAWGLRVAAKTEVPWLIVLRGSQIRLYPARPGVGVGQKGQADTWFELDLAVIDAEQAAFLRLVFAAEALAPQGSTQQLLDGSAQFAVELGERLRDRVYDRAVPRLAQAVAEQLPAMGQAVDAAGLDLAYRLSLKILFRLLFQAYAEDSGLLPYGRNARYDRNALNTWAKDLASDPGQPFDHDSTAIWDDIAQVWRVIDSGDSAWNVPAYNGGLFGSDPALNPEGDLLARMRLGNDTMGPVLAALLVDDIGDGALPHEVGGPPGAVDFRSLSVREFGTIYEGLLESSLSLAPTDLKVDREGTYIPAAPGDEVVVAAGGVYFHSASGQRKSTGTYFTPHIVVEHLLDRALEPVLADHLTKVRTFLDAGDEAAAAVAFFDFRVADLAMGSAHFLTAAIDRIEAGMRGFLTEHPIPAITEELRRLELAAEKALGDDAAVARIEPAALLRRQIARRCVYGLDLNPMAVELARLAIWITTFVPGLPMSSLDHTLVCANSLTGIGTIDEALAALDPASATGTMSLFSDAIHDELAKARDLLVDAANASEATKAEVTAAAHTAIEAKTAAEPARLLFDAVVAARLGLLTPGAYLDPTDLQAAAAEPRIAAAVGAVQPAHFPFLFPEVFLRDNPGFDVILGNPPWEKLKVEEHAWWAVRFPGLRSMPQKDKNIAIVGYKTQRPDLVSQYEVDLFEAKATAKLVSSGPFPGIGATDIDLMAAFAWRFIHEQRTGGSVGVVLPRTAFAGAACEQWRRALMALGDISDLTMIVNNRQWLFPRVHPQYTVALLSFRSGGTTDPTVTLQGPYASRAEFLDGTAHPSNAASFPAAQVANWTGTAAIPLLPDAESLPVFAQLRSHPDFGADTGDWRLRPFTELHTTKDKAFYDFDLTHPAESHTLPVWTGRTFNLWAPGSGTPYAYADPREVVPYLGQRRLASARRTQTAFTGLAARHLSDPDSLPMFSPRIAFRDVARATDSRTMVCCLLPAGVVLVHKAPFLMRQVGDPADEAFVLGVLSTIPFDWYARRFVEVTMSFALLNAMPVPRPLADSPLAVRASQIAGRLAAVDERYADWAAEVGVEVASVKTPEERNDLIAELDAVVSLLYGLSRDQVEHVFETFHRGWDCEPRLRAVLKHYDSWKDRA
ncbi:Eco57I restriction-modification methylase domain-containing protein [Microbacterium sp.]|uniref:Eco57I restriction-modification methylase domain-containing protein n=1 Tax=Microbacterium sp. TaxID=51671 RepID=UPI0027332141|nr:hypothetical protein [Microbacterium sp.]MDP3950531.1 hypothetical protein [Microbacterium sp.]